MSDDPDAEIRLDLRGLKCPLPVLRTRKSLASMTPGQMLRVESTDPLSEIDIPHFVSAEGHELLEATRDGDICAFLIRKT